MTTKVTTDLINTLDASKLTGALPAISGASLTGITTGKILQVVTAYGTGGTSAGTSYVTVGSSSITITPSATSSRIHLTWNTGGHVADVASVFAVAIKGVSSEDGTMFEMYRYAYSNSTDTDHVPCPLFVTHVDSPNSTSSITYSLSAKSGATGGYLTNPDGGSNQVRVIAMEIGA